MGEDTIFERYEEQQSRIATLEADNAKLVETLEHCMDFIADYEAEVGGVSHHGEMVRTTLAAVKGK